MNIKKVFGATDYPGIGAQRAGYQGYDTADSFVKTMSGLLKEFGKLGILTGTPQGAAAATAANAAGGDTDGLFALQMQLQRQAQEFTLRTNIAQAEHDSRMTVIRGIRV